MTDKELLELAAKAAGISWHGDGANNTDMIVMMPFTRIWNPLTSDGDALRVAVKLEMALDLTIAMQPFADVQANKQDEVCNSDPYAATRRAIVRPAAEIGRAK